MSNPYYYATEYTYSGAFIPGTLARAEQVGVEFLSLQSGISLLAYQGIDTGAANAYVVTTGGAPTGGAYVDGMLVQFKAVNANTGSSTLNVNSIGAVGLLRANGSASQAGDITANTWYTAAYNTNFNAWTIITPVPVTGFTNTISSAPPTNKVGLTAAGGVAPAALPIDATFAIDVSINPTWTGAHVFAGGVTFNSTVSFSGSFGFTGTSGQYAQVLTGFNGTGVSFGQKIVAGTNASDVALLVQNRAGTQMFIVGGDGGVQVGSPTGQSQGAGSLNVQTLFINGAAVTAGGASGANPTASVGLTAVNGSASTFLRSDGAPALSVAINPTWTGVHTFSPAASSTGMIFNQLSNQIGIQINSPTGNQALRVHGTGSQNTWLAVDSAAAAGLSLAGGGTTFGSTDFQVYQDVSGNANLVNLNNGAMTFYTNALQRAVIDSNGHWTFNAPSTGGTSNFSFAGRNGNNVVNISQAAGAGGAFGLFIKAGTNASDYAIRVQNQAATFDIFKVLEDSTSAPAIQGGGPVAGALVDMTPDASTFTGTLTGFAATVPTGTCIWSRNGNQVTLFVPAMTGTSNSTSFGMSGLPGAIQPTRAQLLSMPQYALQDASATQAAISVLVSGGTLAFRLSGSATGWQGTGSKGVTTGFTISYLLN